MPQLPSDATRTVPRWLIIVGSVLIVIHVFALLTEVVAAPSGPWGPEGPTAPGPAFARFLDSLVKPAYVQGLKLAQSYRFASNHPESGVRFEVRLKDEAGQPVATVRLPDPRANPWVRHRQLVMAQWLGYDQFVQPRPGEALPAPNQAVKTVVIWDGGPDFNRRLREVPEHLIPRDHPVFSPTEWSLLLARSYVRYLCRAHGAASGEFIRRTRLPVGPDVLSVPEPPPGTYEDLVAHYGELPK